jgi:hypothetical protein
MVRKIIAPGVSCVTLAHVPLFVGVDPHVIFEVSVMKWAAVIDQSRDPTWRRYGEEDGSCDEIDPCIFDEPPEKRGTT